MKTFDLAPDHYDYIYDKDVAEQRKKRKERDEKRESLPEEEVIKRIFE